MPDEQFAKLTGLHIAAALDQRRARRGHIGQRLKLVVQGAQIQKHPAIQRPERIIKFIEQQRHAPIELFAQQRNAVVKTQGRHDGPIGIDHLPAQRFQPIHGLDRRFLAQPPDRIQHGPQGDFIKRLIGQRGHQIAVHINVQRGRRRDFRRGAQQHRLADIAQAHDRTARAFGQRVFQVFQIGRSQKQRFVHSSDIIPGPEHAPRQCATNGQVWQPVAAAAGLCRLSYILRIKQKRVNRQTSFG